MLVFMYMQSLLFVSFLQGYLCFKNRYIFSLVFIESIPVNYSGYFL